MKHYILSLFFILASLTSLTQAKQTNQSIKTAFFAGGCFWCMESDFEKLDGVIKVESGYTGGHTENPTYQEVSHTETGHYEAVKVSYNSAKITYAELLEYYWRKIDPTDDKGQFCDKGSSYKSAIFYQNEAEKLAINQSLQALNKQKPFPASIVTSILPAKKFYLAEDYHQDYYKKNPIRYQFYRRGCGRDKRVKEIWGK